MHRQIKKLVACSIVMISVGLSQSALAAYWVHATQCTGTATIATDGAFSGSETDETKLVCWVDVSKGYGSTLDVDITYTQNPVAGSEGVACRAISYRASGSLVHSTPTVKITGPVPRNKTLTVKDNSASGDNNAVLARIECTLPPNYTDPRNGDTPTFGSFVYRMKVY